MRIFSSTRWPGVALLAMALMPPASGAQPHLRPNAFVQSTEGPAAVASPLQWQNLPASQAESLQWRPVDPAAAMQAQHLLTQESQQRQLAEAAAEQQRLKLASEQPIRGGLYQVKRGSTWLPSISQRVPQAYGSPFLSVQSGFYFSDCGVSGGYVCGDGSKTWRQEVEGSSENDWPTNIGLGDPVKAIGIDLGITISSLATTRPGQSSEGTPFGSGQGINLAISRNLDANTAIKIGAFNLWELDEVQYDAGQSAYGVISSRFDLNRNPEDNNHDLYLTLGLANGVFRPLNVILADQEAECQAEVARQGRRSTYDYGDYCNKWGLDWGSPYPVASVAYMLNPQLSMIAEWWGRNLTLAASIKPFESLNWVITPGVTSLIQNADWDPANPGYTERVRFTLTTSIAF